MSHRANRPTVTVAAAAAALGVHVNTVRNWVRNGHLEARALPSGFARPYLDAVAQLATADADADQLAELADALDVLAARLTQRADALREAAATLRGT